MVSPVQQNAEKVDHEQRGAECSTNGEKHLKEPIQIDSPAGRFRHHYCPRRFRSHFSARSGSTAHIPDSEPSGEKNGAAELGNPRFLKTERIQHSSGCRRSERPARSFLEWAGRHSCAAQPRCRWAIYGDQAIGTGKSNQAGGGARSEVVNLPDVMDGTVYDIDGNNLVLGNSQDWPDQFVNSSPNGVVFSREITPCKATKVPQKIPSTIVRILSSENVALVWPYPKCTQSSR